MADSKTPLTMSDGLTQINQVIAAMQMSPDADQEFLSDLQSVILAKVHAPQQQQGQQGQGQSPQGQSPAGSPVTGPGGPAGASQPGSGQPPMPGQNQLSGPQAAPGQGVMPQPGGGMQDPDELRRFLSTRTGS